MKTCPSCKIEKSKEDFHNSKNRVDGKNPYCKKCVSYKNKQRTIIKAKNRPVRKPTKRHLAMADGLTHYIPDNKCIKCGTSKRLISTHQCSKCLRNRNKSLKTECEKIASRNRKISFVKKRTAINLGKNKYKTGIPCKNGHIGFRLVSTRQCIECLKTRENKPYTLRSTKPNYDKSNSKRRSRAGKVKNKEYYRDVLSKDPKHKMAMFMRSCIRRLFITRTESSAGTLGYTKNDLVIHIESLWLDGMSWDNRSEWHIDHIKSIKSFIDEGITDPKIINDLSNLQPMWPFDNLSKGSR